MTIQSRFLKTLFFTTFVMGSIVMGSMQSASVYAANRDMLVGSGAQTCFNVSQKFQSFDVERDEAIAIVRAVVEKSRIENKQEKVNELSAPINEKHALKTSNYREQLREFALGMLQSELLKENPEEFLLELENFDYVNKFLAQCRGDGQAHDLLYQVFVAQVLDGNHKATWLRITR